jgi:hypothetical protein
MCQHVAAFMKAHNGGGFQAFISRSGGGLRLFLMTGAEAYDFDLSAKLAEFAGPFIENGLLDGITLLPASTPEEMEAFFDPDEALRVAIEDA